jgi:hypothetical protein
MILRYRPLRKKLKNTVLVMDSLFMVTTTTRFMLIYRKPHSVVIPHMLGGRRTLERGFMVEYTTKDDYVLSLWHELLCKKLRDGMYEVMREQAREGLFPLEESEQYLASYVRGFRCQ